MRLTGSGFTRAEKCPPSTFLPHVEEASSVYSRAGHAVHKYLCLVAEVGPEAALELIDEEWRSLCGVIELDSLPHSEPEAWAFEVAYAWDFKRDAARELYRGSGARAYEGLSETEIPGTADLIGMDADGQTVIVLDLKSGWAPLGPPAESLQLGFYAVAAARHLGVSRAIVGWVRLADGVPRYEYALLDEIDLDAMSERLKAVVTSAAFAEVDHQATGALKLSSGSHCTYCPAYLRCPAKATLLRELVAAPDAVPVVEAAQVPAMLQRLWDAREVLDRTEEALKDYVKAHPARLPSGEVYGLVEQEEETLDPLVGRVVLTASYGEDVAKQCLEVKETLTKAALKRVLQPWAKERGLKWAPTERQTLDAIRAAGGARKTTWPVVKLFKPKELKAG